MLDRARAAAAWRHLAAGGGARSRSDKRPCSRGGGGSDVAGDFF